MSAPCGFGMLPRAGVDTQPISEYFQGALRVAMGTGGPWEVGSGSTRITGLPSPAGVIVSQGSLRVPGALWPQGSHRSLEHRALPMSC